jgi:uncharacterized membrane protein
MTVDSLLTAIVNVIVNPTISLLFAIALILFLYGVFKFVKGSDNQTARKEGASHILWGLVGMFIMVSAFALIKIVLNSANEVGLDVDVPSTLE